MRNLSNSGSQTAVTVDATWRTILECAAIEVFEMMASARLEPVPVPPGDPSGENTAMVGLAGALCGMVTIRCTSPTTRKLASLMLGGDAASNPSTMRDALGELCNMVAGNFKSKIANLADHCMLSVPTVITGGDYCVEATEPADGFTVALQYESELVWVALVIHP